jgi:alkanesulfonate monooxygenase SsuD/methylene tetrahydromethanopterin reductase-like flavin-dependent oxidoreductase (luciferase family)
MGRAFRFGCQSFHAASGREWKDKARRAEDLGYSSLVLADHYLGPGPAIASTGHPVQTLAAVPAMTLAAEATTTIRVGCRVMCVDYRNPVVLAKEMATIDLFSEGRLECGLGAGWLAGEYEAMGVVMDAPGRRIARLADVVRVVKAHFGDGECAVEGTPGTGVRAVGFEGVPKPVQRPRPPIMIGGGGRTVLTLAATEADKVAWVREAAGPRADALELEIGAYFTVMTDKVAATAGAMAPMFGLSVEDLLAHPHALIGSVEAVCEELQRRREQYGISYVTVGDNVMEAFAPVVARLAGT